MRAGAGLCLFVHSTRPGLELCPMLFEPRQRVSSTTRWNRAGSCFVPGKSCSALIETSAEHVSDISSSAPEVAERQILDERGPVLARIAVAVRPVVEAAGDVLHGGPGVDQRHRGVTGKAQCVLFWLTKFSTLNRARRS